MFRVPPSPHSTLLKLSKLSPLLPKLPVLPFLPILHPLIPCSSSPSFQAQPSGSQHLVDARLDVAEVQFGSSVTRAGQRLLDLLLQDQQFAAHVGADVRLRDVNRGKADGRLNGGGRGIDLFGHQFAQALQVATLQVAAEDVDGLAAEPVRSRFPSRRSSIISAGVYVAFALHGLGFDQPGKPLRVEDEVEDGRLRLPDAFQGTRVLDPAKDRLHPASNPDGQRRALAGRPLPLPAAPWAPARRRRPPGRRCAASRTPRRYGERRGPCSGSTARWSARTALPGRRSFCPPLPSIRSGSGGCA